LHKNLTSNMKFIRLDLLTLLISLFILGSCKNQNDIGLPTDGQQVDGTLMVYDDIVVNTALEDSVATYGLSRTPLSSMNDNIFGPTESAVATAINLPGSVAYTLPTGTITTDSVVMVMRYNSGFYGDSLNTKYKLNVYQLKEKPLSNQEYYSNDTKVWDRESSLLNDPSKYTAFNARPNSTFKILSIVKGAADTLKTDSLPGVRIRLLNSFVNTNLFSAPAANLASNTAFQNAVKGLYLTLQRNQSSEAGGTLMFNMSTSSINVYYRATNNGTTDTAMVSLPFSTPIATITNRKATYPTAIKTALASTTSNSVFYLQGLAGLRAKIGFPSLKTMFGAGVDINKVAINRAELVITTQPGSDLPPFVAQPLLTFYRLDITKQRARVPDANAVSTSTGPSPLDARFFSAAAFGGDYNSNKREYHFTLTGYIQDLLKGRIADYGAYIGVADGSGRSLGIVDIAPTVQTAGRVVAVGSDKSSPYRIKLNVIYTKNN
jgi:hypothetical protein